MIIHSLSLRNVVHIENTIQMNYNKITMGYSHSYDMDVSLQVDIHTASELITAFQQAVELLHNVVNLLSVREPHSPNTELSRKTDILTGWVP